MPLEQQLGRLETGGRRGAGAGKAKAGWDECGTMLQRKEAALMTAPRL